TYIGDVLLFVNPFKPLDIYSQEVSKLVFDTPGKKIRVNIIHRNNPSSAQTYPNAAELTIMHDISDCVQRADAKPHVFWTAQAALERMLATRHAQCVVVSGESGAGKTETIKQTVSHLTATATSIHPCLDVKINEVNPLLEAFGNARTTMNDNSSRFGKFLELRFTADGQLAGAVLSDYLLEKSRVVQQGPSERNFHIFYYMFAGMSREELRAYSLVAPEEYRILRQDNWPQPVFQSARDLDANRVLYHKQLNIMRLVGFTDWEVSLIFTLLSSILHVTNISFSREEDKENVQIKDTHSLSVGERVVKNKTVEQASDGRDALAKELYARLFGWIVRQINLRLKPDKTHCLGGGSSIGLLDMPGFENLKVNSFEQLCINVANEQVQRFFSEHVFVHERREYERDGVRWRHVQHKDNQNIVDMFLTKPLGVFALIDEEGRFPQATDATLVDKMAANHRRSGLLAKSRTASLAFSVHHYAGTVEYQAAGFLEKNRNSLSTALSDCMKGSYHTLVSDLFKAKVSRTGTISSSFATRPRQKNQRGNVPADMRADNREVVQQFLGYSIPNVKTGGTYRINIVRARHRPPELIATEVTKPIIALHTECKPLTNCNLNTRARTNIQTQTETVEGFLLFFAGFLLFDFGSFGDGELSEMSLGLLFSRPVSQNTLPAPHLSQ
ncbi:hypothetical protein BaRGS_00012694, partial [Batillaria attramentaria]